nr:DUF1413 domain-containing protein [uncultured Romboutsia sp.]
MKNISIRVTEEQYDKIAELSSKEGITMTEFILSKCEVINDGQDLTVASVISKIKDVPRNKEFTIRSLYSYNDWINFSKRSILSVGRTVYNYIDKYDDTELSKIAEFVGKDSSNTAIYRRK